MDCLRNRGSSAAGVAQMALAGHVGVRQYGPSMLTRRSFKRAGVARAASRPLLSVLSFGVPLLALAQALTSCGSDDDGATACEPNVLRACNGPGQCAGEQTCASDGSGYSECSCEGSGSAGASNAGSGGSAGTSNTGGAAGAGLDPLDSLFQPAERAIGAPCVTDADCPVGPGGETPLICMTPTSTAEFTTGSPQGGYCTARCRDTDECVALDVLSGCGLIDEQTGDGYCIGLCTPNGGQINCLSNRAQACFQLDDDTPTVGACFPVCQSDAACGDGQFCDQGRTGLGLCTTTEPPGGDIGAPCTNETAEADCKSGICITLLDAPGGSPTGSFCSANCTFGLLAGCGSTAPAGTARDAICLQPQRATGDVGDLGLCFELCDTAADCTQAGWICDPLTADGQTQVGRVGECVPPGDGAVVVDAGN